VRIFEILTERMNIPWVKSWVKRSADSADINQEPTDWYGDFFQNLNNDSEFNKWVETNIGAAVSIVPRLRSIPGSRNVFLGADYGVRGEQHQIEVEVNVAVSPNDPKTMNSIVNEFSSAMTHELNHAHQRAKQSQRTGSLSAATELDTDSWKKPPPEPRNDNEEYFMYLLDNMEKDAWISQIAKEIYDSLGDSSSANLNKILNSIKREPYITVSGKILNLPELHNLYRAANYYKDYLKGGTDTVWNSVKKNLYSYLQQYR
jgi:hypothetical protein